MKKNNEVTNQVLVNGQWFRDGKKEGIAFDVDFESDDEFMRTIKAKAEQFYYEIFGEYHE